MSHYQKLTCDLTEEEIQNYSNELARLITEQAETEAEKKEVMSDFAAKINKIIADSRVLSRKVTTRKEERQVECDYEYDYTRGVVFTVRMDTGVTIGQRKLTDEERQERLDFDAEQEREAEAAEERPVEAAQNKPPADPPSDGVATCANTACDKHSPSEPNGCIFYECPWECPNAVGEVVKLEEDPTLTELCARCHAESGCDRCCKTCQEKCSDEMICSWPDAETEL